MFSEKRLQIILESSHRSCRLKVPLKAGTLLKGGKYTIIKGIKSEPLTDVYLVKCHRSDSECTAIVFKGVQIITPYQRPTMLDIGIFEDIHEVFLENDTYVAISSYINYPTLADLIQANTIFTAGQFNWLASEILNAVNTLHKMGMVHAGINVNNIFVTPTGVILGGVGLKMQCPNTEKLPMEYINILPPEIFIGEGELGPWTDIYTVGKVLLQVRGNMLPDELMFTNFASGNLLKRMTVETPSQRPRSVAEVYHNLSIPTVHRQVVKKTNWLPAVVICAVVIATGLWVSKPQIDNIVEIDPEEIQVPLGSLQDPKYTSLDNFIAINQSAQATGGPIYIKIDPIFGAKSYTITIEAKDEAGNLVYETQVEVE